METRIMTAHDAIGRAVQEAFVNECAEIFERMAQVLVEIEQSSDFELRENLLRGFKRDLHTLKGAAASVGRTALLHLCHAQEDFLAGCAERRIELTQMHFDLMHRVMRAMQAAATADSDVTATADVELCMALLQDRGALSQTSISTVVSVPAEAQDVWKDSGQNHPSHSDASGRVAGPGAGIADADVAGSAESQAGQVSESVRVAASKLEMVQALVGELVVVGLQQKASEQAVAVASSRVTGMQSDWRALASLVRDTKPFVPEAAWRKLEMRLSTFGQRIKEVQQEGFHNASELASHVSQLGLVSDALEDGLRSMRMLPLAPFLKGFAVTVRDAARHKGVDVHLDVIDRNIEIDRLVLERLRDPILHMVRNAVAHGIESPALRRQHGKSVTGEIRLDASLDGDHVVIVLADDGGGIDRSAVLQRARSLGMVVADAQATDSQVLDILCHPGFSTATQVNALSGRGVGMDVAMEAIQNLHGTLSMQSVSGVGTQFHLRVPSRASTTRGLIVRTGQYLFGIPLDSVERIVRIDASKVVQLDRAQVIYVEGSPITLGALGEILKSPQYAKLSGHRSLPTVILRSGNERLAVLVDDILGEFPVVVKPLGHQFKQKLQFAGGAVQADGSVLVMLDPRQLLRAVISGAFGVDAVGPSDAHEPADVLSESQRVRTVLVVDDSITTRTMERNILEAAGYRVIVATDGEEALDVLRLQDNVDLLVTDMQMPRMDGVTLCMRVRQDLSSSMPIIMVTSVGDETEQRRGIDAGADAYIIKGNFQQDHFLTTIRRLVG